MRSVNALFALIAMTVNQAAKCEGYSYQEIAKRYKDTALSFKEVKTAKMQGECLVGIKQLNFRKRYDFDPVAEWSAHRAAPLLERYTPCEALIILEKAQKVLKSGEVKFEID